MRGARLGPAPGFFVFACDSNGLSEAALAVRFSAAGFFGVSLS
jgi:hypothetical protein